MQTSNRLRIEYALLAVYLVSGLGILFGIFYARYVAVISGGLLGFLYFYASFWLYGQSGISVASRIVAGLCYSVTMIATEFCLLRWPGWLSFIIISVAGLVLMSIISLTNYKKPGYKAQLYRCIFFFTALAALCSFRYFTGEISTGFIKQKPFHASIGGKMHG